MKWSNLFVAAALMLMVPVTVQVFAQNNPGIRPEGTITPGNCMKFGTSANRAADAGGPCNVGPPTAPLAIGSTVTGATPNKCLTVDATGKLAQENCLLAR